MTAVSPTSLPPSHPRFGLSRRWTGPARVASPGSLFDAVLAARGLSIRRDTWFGPRPDFDGFDKPYLRDDFREAADLILAVIAAGRRIAIYGDYDADGITATAILFHAIRALEPGLMPRCYIPHRRQEGYGLHLDALRTLRSEGIDLVVTVDCGIIAIDEVAAARAEGLGVVVTDHHEPRRDGRIPEADAVVHPRLPGREHDCRECCGAMVAWKLAWTLFDRRAGSPDRRRLPEALGRTLMGLSALAAIGTVADVMPLLGPNGECLENREVVRLGLANARRSGIPGLDALWSFGDIASDGVTAEAIGYRLAPRLNAAGRLGSAEAALRLLTVETDPRRCVELVRELDRLNSTRKDDEREAFRQALEKLRRSGEDVSPRGIVLSDPGWNSGLVGIVCSRLLERFGCPVLLFEETEDGGVAIAKGSGRAPPGFPLLDAIESAIDSAGIRPRKWGGHAAAAGMTLALADLERFRAAFRSEAERRIPSTDLGSELPIDLELRAESAPGLLTLESVEELERLAPFGRGNPRPTVLLRGVRIPVRPKAIGRDGTHLSMNLRIGDAERSDAFFPARWWNASRHAESIRPGGRVDAVVTPRVDRFLGEEKVLLEICDLAPG